MAAESKSKSKRNMSPKFKSDKDDNTRSAVSSPRHRQTCSGSTDLPVYSTVIGLRSMKSQGATASISSAKFVTDRVDCASWSRTIETSSREKVRREKLLVCSKLYKKCTKTTGILLVY